MCGLKTIRKAINVSQSCLAKRVGCSQGAIGHYENKRRIPNLDTCRALVRALNELGAEVELDDVFPPEISPSRPKASYQPFT